MKKSIYYLCFLLLFLSCSIGGSPKKSPTLQVISNDRSASFSFTNLNNWLIVPIILEGQSEPLNFLFDTGSASVLTEKTAAKLLIEPHRVQTVMGANGVTRQVDVALIKQLEVGNLSVRNAEMAIVKDAELSAFKCHRDKIDGIFGGDLIRTSNWEIDFSTSTIRTGVQSKDYEVQLPFQIKNRGIPVMEMEVEGKMVSIVFDTGNNGSVLLSDKQIDIKGLAPLPGQMIYGVNTKTATGTIEENGVLFQGLSFAHDSKMVGRYASVLMPISNNYFGMSAIRKANVVFLDYEKNRVHLGHRKMGLSPYSAFGFQVEELNGGIVLTRVMQSLKDQRNLKPGMPIESILDAVSGEPFQTDVCLINAVLAQKDSVDLIFSSQKAEARRFYKQSIFQ